MVVPVWFGLVVVGPTMVFTLGTGSSPFFLVGQRRLGLCLGVDISRGTGPAVARGLAGERNPHTSVSVGPLVHSIGGTNLAVRASGRHGSTGLSTPVYGLDNNGPSNESYAKP